VTGNIATGGAGGAGGLGGGPGGNGGVGGLAQGAGIFLSNTVTGTYTVTFNGGSASNNQLTGGAGGAGGNAGGAGVNKVLGGNGGDAGLAQGGGVFLQAGANSVINSTISALPLDGNTVTGGVGGVGGAGTTAAGGVGGMAAGGGLFSNTLNTTTLGLTTLTGVAVGADVVSAGDGGNAGTGTTTNGGDGGNGGEGGNAQGGGIFAQTNLFVVDSTIGGTSADPSHPDINRNILSAGNGGRGGNGGTAGNTLPSSNGGNGGAAGSTMGGGVFFGIGQTIFQSDTIVGNEATISIVHGAGGAAGNAAGDGTGKPGTAGADGTASGGGLFATPSVTSNTFGNTIIDLNSTPSGTMTAAGPDAFAAINSNGHNIIGSTDSNTGFASNKGDLIGVTAAQLAIGPLFANGGPSPTDALLTGSVAIDAGNNSLVPAGDTADQRGPGFARVVGAAVDIGAFEVQPAPAITNLSPNTDHKGSGPLTINITGTDLLDINQVNFGTFVLAPTAVTATQVTVVVPVADLYLNNPVNVSLSQPDGSGTGATTNSNTLTFTLTPPITLPLNGPGNQTNNESDIVSGIAVTSPDPVASGFSATNLPAGLGINPTTGIISGTIGLRAAGVYNVVVSASDSGTIGTTSFTWTVADTTPPSITSPGNQMSAGGDTASLTLVSDDGESFTASNLPPGLSIDNTGKISGTIPPTTTGTFGVTVTAFDGTLNSSINFVWTVVTMNNPGNQTNNEGDAVSLVVTPTDPNSTNFSATNLPPGLSISPISGTISGNIGLRAAGTYNVTVSAVDGSVNPRATFTWTINDTTPPGLTNPGIQNSTTGNTVNLTIVSVDADSFSATGLPTGLSINSSGVITGTIPAGAAGS
jgi:hypothetical protein